MGGERSAGPRAPSHRAAPAGTAGRCASPAPGAADTAATADRAGPAGYDRARRGDRAALEALVRAEWRRVHRIVVAAAGSRAEADDLTQEAFARVLPRLGHLETAGAFAAYLDQVARNLVRDRFRRHRFVAGAPVEDGPVDAPGPEAEAMRRYDRATVRQAMDQLPDDYRTVLRLRLQEGRSGSEVARRMGRSAAAVRQLQHRALVALRQEYQRVAAGQPRRSEVVTRG